MVSAEKPSVRRLVLATQNPGKIRELTQLLAGSFDVVGLDPSISWEETGVTFRDNALIKARVVWEKTKGCVLADDSGLCVDALGGEPGVYSARWAGDGATERQAFEKLLKTLGNEKRRGAHYVACLVWIDEKGQETVFESRCHGSIAKSASGNGGFGYDPIFIPNGFAETFGTLPSEVKQRISHRVKALSQLLQFLKI